MEAPISSIHVSAKHFSVKINQCFSLEAHPFDSSVLKSFNTFLAFLLREIKITLGSISRNKVMAGCDTQILKSNFPFVAYP